MSGSDGGSYVEKPDGATSAGAVSIRWPKVLGTVATMLITFGFAAVLTTIETLVNLQVWIINTLGDAQAKYVESYLTEGAGIWDASLNAAVNSFSTLGVAAPFVAVVEIIVLLGFAALLWSVVTA